MARFTAYLAASISIVIGIVLCFALAVRAARAADNGQWADSPPYIRQWFNTLKQPDQPAVSCCGEADAFEADQWSVRPDGDLDVTITKGWGFIATGTVVRVPKKKLQQNAGNPTGHAILFLSLGDRTPYCFVVGGLI